MKKEITSLEYWTIFGLSKSINEHYQKIRDRERIVQEILEHDETYFGHLSDMWYEDTFSMKEFDEAIRAMGIRVVDK